MRTVTYSNLVDQFYYAEYDAFTTDRETEEIEDWDTIPGVFVNGKPATRREQYGVQDERD